MKLFLEQFAIKSCILNSELPAKIRCHAVTQFNRNFYDIIIASDERSLDQPDMKVKRLGPMKIKNDKESGVARGIDFQCVSNVINFDFPLDVNSYVHRAGRTARGNNTVNKCTQNVFGCTYLKNQFNLLFQGSVLSFADIKEKPLMESVEEHLKTGYSTEDSVIKYENNNIYIDSL